jgi:hypothetical protein
MFVSLVSSVAEHVINTPAEAEAAAFGRAGG